MSARRDPLTVRCAVPALGWLALLATPASAQGGGPSLYEVGTPDMGLSAAGAVARAGDAATAYTNPAGMVLLEGDQALFGSYALVVIQDLALEATGTVSVPAGSLDGGGRSTTPQPGIGAYGVGSFGDWRWGIALNAPFAGGSDYDGDWVGRAFVTDSSIVGLNLEPSLARRVSESVSLGVGLRFFHASLENERRASTAAGAPLVTLEAEDVGFGLTLGAMLEVDRATRLGLTYRSPIDLELEGELDSAGTPDATLEFTVPQSVSLGLRHELGPGASLLADLGWSDWSAFSRQRSSVGPMTSTLDRNWHDTWRVGVGGEVEVAEGWRLQGGLGFDSSAVDDEDLLPDIPFQDSMRYSLGLQHRVGKRWSVGLTYTFMDRGHPRAERVALPPTNTVVLDGEFAESKRHFLGLTLGWSM